jgi:hypothetical protein
MANVFEPGQQREAENIFSELKIHVNGVISFLYFIDKPGKVHDGRPNRPIKLNANIPERGG